MTALPQTMDWDSSIPNYVEEDVESITAEERENRARLDELVDKVHESHSQVGWRPGTDPSVNITKERQKLLEQCRRLPGDPKLKLRTRVGEVLVTFYNHVLHSPPDEDEDDADEYESEPDIPNLPDSQEQKQKSTCRPVPLQYLYKIRNDGLEMIERKDLFSYLPNPEGNGSRKRINSSGNLRIIEFPTPTCASDFLKSVKGVSLEELTNSPKAAITKIQSDRHSPFLTGVAHYPNLPPRLPVAQDYPRVSYRSGTLLFVAIPYFGRESKSSASFRREPPIQIQTPDSRSQQERAAEKLTAYPIVDGDNGRPSSISSLSLFQYKFPLQPDTKVFDKWQTTLDAEECQTVGGTETGEESIVVHQALFMVFDDATIAAFRSPSDIRPEHAPLYPIYCDSVGAYHALINIIYDLLRSTEFPIPQKFRQVVSELESLMQTHHEEWVSRAHSREELAQAADRDKDLTLRLRTVETELSAILNVVDAQIEVLRSLRQFRLRKGTEQWKIMGKTIDMVIEGRECFRENIKSIFKDLQASQQLFRHLSAETARIQAEIISNQLITATEATRRSAEAVTKVAREASEKNIRQWKKQGAKMTLLTVIMTMFTPLTFMTSYRGMNLSDIKNTTLKQGKFWILSLLFTASVILIVILLGLRRESVKGIKFVKWISSRLSPSNRRSKSTAASSASSSTSESSDDCSDSVSHSSCSDDLEARVRREGAWKKFWEKPPKGEDYWDYN